MMKTYFTLFVMTIFFLVSAQGQLNWDQGNLLELSKQKWIKKSMLLLVGLFIFTSVVLKAQSPQKINFQSIVRNTSGVIVSNKSVNFKITILSGTITGTPVYSETHLKTTDAIGLVSLQIGTGTVVSGVFSSIDWGNALHFIKLEADFSGGNTYVTLGTQELMSVPYALYSAKTDTNSLNLSSRLSTKLNWRDTASLSNRIDAKVNIADTSNMLSNYRTGINAKVNIADTTNMLSNYRTGINAKVNISDTSNMLANYRTGINAKVNTSDTSSMLSKYLRKADFPSGTSVGEFMYWNGSKWVNLSPGTTGQSIIMSSNGTPTWGCLITNSAGTPSSSSPLSVNIALTTAITIATTGATDIGTATGLPDGLTATWSANVITISGTPTNTGTFNYTIPLTGGCGIVEATGTITVTACPTPTVGDIDGNTYNTVSIGNQCWTKENLRVSRYNDGTLIPIVTDATAWGSLATGGRSWYNNDSTTYEIPYGNLYNWYAVTDSKKLCPTGWHVPTDAEWTILTDFLGGESVAGTKMKSTGTDYWSSESAGTDNSSGFSALPGGFRFSDGGFYNIRDVAFFWSATGYDGHYAWSRRLFNYYGGVARWTYQDYQRSVGGSVRCLRD